MKKLNKKLNIINTLCLKDITSNDINKTEAFVGDILKIHSIDILELVMTAEANKAFSSL
jgi:acyl carrier protein